MKARYLGGCALVLSFAAGCGDDAHDGAGGGGDDTSSTSADVAVSTGSTSDVSSASTGAGPFDNGVTTVTTESSANDPAWEVVDWNIVVAGPEVVDAAWPFDDLFGSKPHQPHAGPYDHEVSDNLLAAGFDSGNRFLAQDWVDRDVGIFVLADIVPTATAPDGVSYDFDDGPIIPTDVWGARMDTWLFREGEQVSHDGGGFPRVEIPGVYEGSGHSHLPLLIWFSPVNMDWWGTTGAYHMIVELYVNDASRRIDIDFTME